MNVFVVITCLQHRILSPDKLREEMTVYPSQYGCLFHVTAIFKLHITQLVSEMPSSIASIILSQMYIILPIFSYIQYNSMT